MNHLSDTYFYNIFNIYISIRSEKWCLNKFYPTAGSFNSLNLFQSFRNGCHNLWSIVYICIDFINTE